MNVYTLQIAALYFLWGFGAFAVALAIRIFCG